MTLARSAAVAKVLPKRDSVALGIGHHDFSIEFRRRLDYACANAAPSQSSDVLLQIMYEECALSWFCSACEVVLSLNVCGQRAEHTIRGPLDSCKVESQARVKVDEMQDRGLRYDTIIAVSALLISAITSATVVYQTHVISQQFSATVWPYLSFETTRDASHLGVNLRNDGVGPALIRTVHFTLDGKSIPSLSVVVDPLVRQAIRSRSHGVRRTSVSSIEAGDVLPANQHVALVQVEGAQIASALLADAPRLNLSVCYCSLLGRCWIKQFKDLSTQPRDVRNCAKT